MVSSCFAAAGILYLLVDVDPAALEVEHAVGRDVDVAAGVELDVAGRRDGQLVARRLEDDFIPALVMNNQLLFTFRVVEHEEVPGSGLEDTDIDAFVAHG